MARSKTIILCALMVLAGSVDAEMSQEQAERAVETRQSVLHLMGWNMAPLGAMARDRIEFDAARAETNATRLQALTNMMADAFAADTRANDVATDALGVIWEQPDDFAAKIQDAIDASDALAAAASSGDESAIRKAIGNMGSSCGSCHDNYKADD